MKYLAISFAFLLHSYCCFTQSWKTNEIDEFTSDLVRITKRERVTGNLFYRHFSVGQNGDVYYLMVIHSGGSSTPICKSSDSKIIFKFSSGETLTVDPTDEIDCSRNMTIYYPLSATSREILYNSDLDKFRIYYTQGYKDYDCTKQDYFRRTLSLFTEL